MKKLGFFAALLFSVSVFSQNFTQAYQDRANLMSQTNINSYLTEFATLGVKKTGTVSNNNAFSWLKSKYLYLGYGDLDISENAFSYGGNQTKNIIVTKTGTTYPNTFIIICGHYDTIAGPGVNDNGSGVSVILEMARILKDIPTEYSIKFINFTGEEQGLLGSQNYVNTVVNSTSPKMDIKLVFNIDQVGGVAGQVNNTITCERDTNNNPATNNAASSSVTQELMNCVGLYSPLQTNLYYAYGSDYMPFQSNGEVITGFYEFRESTKPHTAADTYMNMDPVFVYNVGKAALGAVQHFAVAQTTTLAVDCPPEEMLESLKIYPNPANDYIQIEMINLNQKDYTFTITDLTGRTLIQTKNEKRIDVSKLSSGIYLGTMMVEDQKVTRKLMIKK
ncbi:M28 family peptidase [Kaistella antarctica]|uniref:Arginyl aminopeptidase n=1 Tax=Kaistella antarctica TaxID=266748 RepID=A0A3S4YGD4_9FLAO|nr:M28 family peptidase [Kaistella antarctica]KEY19936.1 leucyl aminopeptidase [Kaistella antarctica]SEV95679.1 Por secretion system C-terminal sorting domain-containing protein [Kaistella antarctica]VEH96037.1 Arginyl aminopeptidase [Kaistella antarctica]